MYVLALALVRICVGTITISCPLRFKERLYLASFRTCSIHRVTCYDQLVTLGNRITCKSWFNRHVHHSDPTHRSPHKMSAHYFLN